MTIAEKFAYVLRMMKEGDDETAQAVADLPDFPRLSRLIEAHTLPSRSLLFGVASDGFPVVLNLLDPTPGPILVIGDAGSGKTSFLRVAAQSAVWSQSPRRVQFAVITATPEAWAGWDSVPHHLVTLSPYAAGIRDLLFDMAAWAQTDQRGQSRLFLIDDLSALLHLDAETLENLQWILTNGPNFGLWPIVTVNTLQAFNLPAWGQVFRTRVFGWIDRREDAYALAPASPATDLLAGAQFCMRSRRGAWTRRGRRA
ncbi:MAG: FtsK/SpoIIIE domain-containing protein [Anaerolineales bacterium]